MDQATLRDLSDEASARVLSKDGTRQSNRGGWMMIATILIEAWDLYSISFLLIFVKADFNPTAAELGLASAAVQAGALIGALGGGWVADKLGRKKVFIWTMILFVVLALAQGFAQDMWQLTVIRFFLGIPLGSDISNGYAYIMESMPRGKREKMGSRWQFMFGVGEVIAIVVITIMYLTGMDHDLLWRIGLALGAVPALLLLVLRLDLPETPSSLIQRGRFRQAKQVSKELFDDDLEMLPDEDFTIDKPKVGDFLKIIWADPIKKRATIFGWISNAMQGAEFSAFGFYLPTILVLTGVSGITATNFLTAGIYVLATISGFTAPLVIPRIGHRGVAMVGYGMAFVSLLLAALFLQVGLLPLVPLAAAGLMWGHYWDASNGMTITSMVAPSRFRATASGFGYVFVKAASFVTIFLFPVLFEAVGVPAATAIVSLLSLTGFLAAKFILPEMYGYVDSESITEGDLSSRTLALSGRRRALSGSSPSR